MSIFTIYDQLNRTQDNIDYLEQKLAEEKQKQEDLLNQKISIRLADLIGEISSLSDVNILDMNINITTNIFIDAQRPDFTMEYAKKRQEGHNLEVQILGNKSVRNVHATPFKFYLYFPLDFEKKQADGKTLLDHCSARPPQVTSISFPQKEIVVNKNIGDLVCDFTVRQLQNNGLSIPKELVIGAVENCFEKEKIFREESTKIATKQEEKTL